MPTPPLTPPPATLNGRMPPRSDWSRFANRATASDIFALVEAAVAAIPGVKITAPLKLVDGINDGEDGFVLTYPLDPLNPLPSDVTTWHIEGDFTTADGQAYLYNDYAGVIARRQLVSDPEQGDTNSAIEGHGADAQRVTIPGKVSIELLPYAPTGLAQAIWIPA